jgi:hypothetical protein
VLRPSSGLKSVYSGICLCRQVTGKVVKPEEWGERKEPDLVQWEIWVVSDRSFSSQVGIGVMGKGSPSREQFFLGRTVELCEK